MCESCIIYTRRLPGRFHLSWQNISGPCEECMHSENSHAEFGNLNWEKRTPVTLALLVGGKASIWEDTFQGIRQSYLDTLSSISPFGLAGPCWIAYCSSRIDALPASFPPAGLGALFAHSRGRCRRAARTV